MSPICRIVSEKLSFRTQNFNKECVGSETFLPPSRLAVFDSCYFLYYCLQRAENCTKKIDQLYHLVNLTCAYDYALCWLPRVLMSKNVNKDSSAHFCLKLKIQIFYANIAINDQFRVLEVAPH